MLKRCAPNSARLGCRSWRFSDASWNLIYAPERSVRRPLLIPQDAVVLEIEVREGECGRFVHAKPVVVDQKEERAIARRADPFKETGELVLSEISR